jgi:NTP pyrophosphatase (non-canonical NTP hydrolase)
MSERELNDAYGLIADLRKRIEALERPRPEVRAFALLMEHELAKHDDRGEWKAADKVAGIRWLYERLLDEAEEVHEAIEMGASVRMLGKETADVANFAMMIADVAGALAQEKPEADGESTNKIGPITKSVV